MLVRMWENRSSHSPLVEMVQRLWKAVWQFLTKLSILLLYNPTIMLLRIYSEELTTYVHTKLSTWMFIAALFILPKLGISQDGFDYINQ